MAPYLSGVETFAHTFCPTLLRKKQAKLAELMETFCGTVLESFQKHITL